MQNAADDYAGFKHTAGIMQIADKRQKTPPFCITANIEGGGWRATLDLRLIPIVLSFNNKAEKFVIRAPKRLTITIPHSTFEAIAQRSNEEGRSLSNLAAFILERGINE